MQNKKNVVVLGKGPLALNIANWFFKDTGYELRAIVPVIPEPEWTESISEWAKSRNINTIDSGHYKNIFDLKNSEWNIDLAVSCMYDKIFNEWFINKCKKIINIHNSPLPKYRGVSSIQWAFKNEESLHGITIHEVVKSVDTGPVIAQLVYSIYPYIDEVQDVYDRANEYGWVLFKQTIPLLDKIIPIPQDESSSTYYNKHDIEKLGDRKFLRRNSEK